jgi:hypothetical protein
VYGVVVGNKCPFPVVNLLSWGACRFAVSSVECQIPFRSVAQFSFVSVFLLWLWSMHHTIQSLIIKEQL